MDKSYIISLLLITKFITNFAYIPLKQSGGTELF